ncbi:Ig-like domain-containing protein [Deinococcus yavapaiensis]|uniref:Ig-like domain-containing protein n=1 Tax=Deinococcus yavapaiensis KR-236 TaxID=694435 RepID=A0A318SAC1_9DEIO|nr:Ig-like domain-containing protein [Deinococcus yavapaiensis]PYE54120.1 hypothetical protein DES52_10685 [Deinococcus yavapaiensis KR-236]
MNRIRLLLPFLSLLVACGGGGTSTPPPTEPVAVPKVDPQTRVTDAETRAALTSLTFDNATLCQPTDSAFPRTATQNKLVDVRTTPFTRCQGHFTFSKSTPLLSSLQAGNILVGQPGPGAPYGYLQRVKSVSTSGATVTVLTEQASLDEALIEGEFDRNETLTPSDLASLSLAPGVSASGLRAQSAPSSTLGAQTVLGPLDSYSLTIDKVLFDVDGNSSTTTDQVRLKGSFNLATDSGITMGLKWKKILGVPIYPNGVTFRMAYGFNQSANVRVEAELETSIDKEVELAKYTFSPITFFVGPVPVVLIPTVQVTSDLKGNVKAKMTFGASESITARAGFEYNDGFHNISEFNKSFSKYLETSPITGSVEGGLNLKGDILLYGLVGPYARIRGAVKFDAQIPRDPVWTLSAGIQGYVGIHADLLVKTLDYDTKIFDLPLFEFGRSAPLPPTISITSPTNGAQLQRNGLIFGGLCVSALDPQQGVLQAQVKANGTSIGTTTSGCLTLPASVLANPGDVTFTATVTNSKGLSASATSSVKIVNVPPTPYIVKPSDTDKVYDGQKVTLQGYVVSGSDKLDCPLPSGKASLTFTSSQSADVMPSDVCANPIATFNGAGTRVLTLRATDTVGEVGTTTRTITVLAKPTNYPPDVALLEPLIKDPTNPPSYSSTNATVSLKARVIDQDTANVSYTWRLRPRLSSTPVLLSNGTASGANAATGTIVTGSFNTSALLPGKCGGLSGEPFSIILEVNDGTTTVTREFKFGTQSGIC